MGLLDGVCHRLDQLASCDMALSLHGLVCHKSSVIEDDVIHVLRRGNEIAPLIVRWTINSREVPVGALDVSMLPIEPTTIERSTGAAARLSLIGIASDSAASSRSCL